MAKKDSPVSDEELDTAAAEGEEEAAAESDTGDEGEKTDKEKQTELEAAEAEEAKLKEEEHKERSALGRKVKGIEEKFDALDTKIDQLLATREKDESEDEDFVPSTKKELDDYLTKWKAGETQKDRKYQDDYMLGIGKFREDEDFKEIKEELNKNFNFRNSDNGVLDAEVNYLKASRAYLKKKLSGVKPENPLKGDKPKGPLGVGSDGEPIEEGEAPAPKLDKYAQDFVNKTGMKEESVKEALTGPTPSYLGGK